MADTATATAAPAPAAPPKKAPAAKKAPKSPKVKAPKSVKKPSTHPKISTMVDDAIKGLGERGGSSLKAIKKYILTKHKIDVEKLAPFIRRYIKSGVKNGALVQAKGKGANGSFKLPQKGVVAKKPAAGGAKPKQSVVKSAPSSFQVKKAAGTKGKKASISGRSGSPVKHASAPKAKKPNAARKKALVVKKSPVKKTTKVINKAPKPKKAIAKKPAPKKTAPPKKK